jgi:tRNA nucleotidyltransferase (CCA-adding enzyme)
MNPSTGDLHSASSSPPAIEDFIGRDQWPLFSELRKVAESLTRPVYLVGGPVRDWLMGWQVRDLDFVTESDAPALARALAQRVNGRVIVHDRFGTATVELEGARIDLVTARKEAYPVPGALPTVKPSSLQDDLARRDFTINSMALPIDGALEGLVDPFGGRDDLRKGLVRTIFSRSFDDDPTRLFRAVRYEQRFGFQLTEETLDQFMAAVDRRNCDTVSGDRLRHELELICREQSPDKVLGRATGLGLLASIVPGLGQGEQVAQWAESESSFELEPGAEWYPWLAALAYPLTSADEAALIRRLNMPRTWAEVVRSSIELREMESSLADDGLPLSALVGLLKSHDIKTVRIVAAITESLAMARNLNRYLDSYGHLKPVLNGDDLLEMGVPSGPLIGRVLADLRDMRLDRRVNSEEEERQWVKGLLASRGFGCN